MEIILFIIIIVAIGIGLFNHGAKLGAETYKLKEEVNAFSKKYNVSINWYSSIPRATNEMLWIAYCYPDNDSVHYEVCHNLGFHRELKEFDSLNAIYFWQHFQFEKIVYFKNAQELISYKEQKKMEGNLYNFKPLSPEEVEKRRVPIHSNPGKPLETIKQERLHQNEVSAQGLAEALRAAQVRQAAANNPRPIHDILIGDKFTPQPQENRSKLDILIKPCPFCGGGIIRSSRICDKCGTGFPVDPDSNIH